MFNLIAVLIILASIALILVVLVQKSKGGGLASGFSSSNQIMGVRKTTDFVEKATWALAGFIIIMSLASAAFYPKRSIQNDQPEVTVPTLPTSGDVAPDMSTPFPTSTPETQETE